MMYKHQIEKMISENREFLNLLIASGRTDDAHHVSDRIRSLKQLLPDAPVAYTMSSTFAD